MAVQGENIKYFDDFSGQTGGMLSEYKNNKKLAGLENRGRWPGGIIPARRERVYKERRRFIFLYYEIV
jgi:hypothetical protein